MNRDCMEYKGKCYGVGTRLRIRPRGLSVFRVGTIIACNGGSIVVKFDDGFSESIGKLYIQRCDDIEIITPVYCEDTNINAPTKSNNNCPPSWEVEVAWIWYIVIMLVLVIFKARWIGWIATTAIFFLWKNGFFNGGKKK